MLAWPGCRCDLLEHSMLCLSGSAERSSQLDHVAHHLQAADQQVAPAEGMLLERQRREGPTL